MVSEVVSIFVWGQAFAKMCLMKQLHSGDTKLFAFSKKSFGNIDFLQTELTLRQNLIWQERCKTQRDAKNGLPTVQRSERNGKWWYKIVCFFKEVLRQHWFSSNRIDFETELNLTRKMQNAERRQKWITDRSEVREIWQGPRSTTKNASDIKSGMKSSNHMWGFFHWLPTKVGTCQNRSKCAHFATKQANLK